MTSNKLGLGNARPNLNLVSSQVVCLMGCIHNKSLFIMFFFYLVHGFSNEIWNVFVFFNPRKLRGNFTYYLLFLGFDISYALTDTNFLPTFLTDISCLLQQSWLLTLKASKFRFDFIIIISKSQTPHKKIVVLMIICSIITYHNHLLKQ